MGLLQLLRTEFASPYLAFLDLTTCSPSPLHLPICLLCPNLRLLRVSPKYFSPPQSPPHSPVTSNARFLLFRGTVVSFMVYSAMVPTVSTASFNDREGEYGPVFSDSVSSEVCRSFCLRWISHLRRSHFVHESNTNETSFPLVLINSDFIKSDGQLRLSHLTPTLRGHFSISSSFQSFTDFLSADASRPTLSWRTEASFDEGTTFEEVSTGVKMCGCKWAWISIDVADFEPFYSPLKSGPDQVQQAYHSRNNPDSSVQSLLLAHQTIPKSRDYSPWQLFSKSHSDIYSGVRDSR